jgi:hypothetical protein
MPPNLRTEASAIAKRWSIEDFTSQSDLEESTDAIAALAIKTSWQAERDLLKRLAEKYRGFAAKAEKRGELDRIFLNFTARILEAEIEAMSGGTEAESTP